MSWLAERLQKSEPLILPGAYDAFSALLIERSGFEACYCGGFSTSASAYGMPDLGLLGLDEMASHYQRVSNAIDIPLIVDADTGQGGLLNVQRTINVLAKSGAVACHLEDQVYPKRCGHLDGKSVVDIPEAIQRVRAAVDAANLNSTAVIARTDAIAVSGFSHAIDRAQGFLEVGASAIFVDAPQTIRQIREISKLVNGPVLYNAAPIGPFADLSTQELIDFGYQIVIHPIELLLAASASVSELLKKLSLSGNPGVEPMSDMNVSRVNQILKTKDFLLKEKSLSSF